MCMQSLPCRLSPPHKREPGYEASMYTYHRLTDLMRSLDIQSAGLLLFRILLFRLKV